MASQPTSVTSNGTTLVLLVPTIANLAAPTVAELTAGSVVDLSCYITGDGLSTEVTENTIDDPRLCSKQIYSQPGDQSNSLELTYVFNPASPDDDEARLALTEGSQDYVVIRWAMDSDTAIAAGQEVDIYPKLAGVQRKIPVARNSVHRITQRMHVTGEVLRDVAVAA